MPQSLSKILVHIVFSTKNKEPLLQRQIRPELYSYLAGVLQEYESPALKIGGIADHVHILCSMNAMSGISPYFIPNTALSGLVSLPMPRPRALPWARLFRPIGAIKAGLRRLLTK